MTSVTTTRLVLVVLVTLTLTTRDVWSLTDTELALLTAEGHVTVSDGPDGHYSITSDGVPEHETANYPNPHNPNEIIPQDHDYVVPASPSTAKSPSCLPMGPIGMSTSGIPFYSPYTIDENNAVEGPYAETFDMCDGHPDPFGAYHYHMIPGCIAATEQRDGLVGIAFDGYPIYSKYTVDGTVLTSADLDECHGRTVDGIGYRYHLTDDFPYIMGCFTGQVHSSYAAIQQRPDCNMAISDYANSALKLPLSMLTFLVAMSTSLYCSWH